MSKPFLERQLEHFLFAARWLLAPIYVGLAVALIGMLGVFGMELWRELHHLLEVPAERLGEAAILMALGLIDLSLSMNLLLIVIFSGYENFVSRIDVAGHEERPDWMGTVDFSALKMKLIASIVAISAISLLRTFLAINDGPINEPELRWQVILHLAFVVSGLLLAIMDYVGSRTEKHAPRGHAPHRSGGALALEAAGAQGAGEPPQR
jgi:uncharacterized protein (TIGR00645 family)